MKITDNAGGWLSLADIGLSGVLTAIGAVLVPVSAVVIAVINRPRSLTRDAALKLYSDLREAERLMAERDQALREKAALEADLEACRRENEMRARRIEHLEDRLYGRRESES